MYTSTIWKKVQKLGFVPFFNRSDFFSKWIETRMVLPFLMQGQFQCGRDTVSKVPRGEVSRGGLHN